MNEIVINRNEILELGKEGGKLVLTPSAQERLVKLLEIQKFIDNVVEQVKKEIVSSALEIDEDFKGIVADKVKVSYRYTETPYDYDRSMKDIAEPFLKEVSYSKIDSEKIEKYLGEFGELPEGISYKSRDKKLILELKE